MTPLLSVEDALAKVLERAVPLPAEPVAVPDAAGRVLREAAVSAVGLPLFPSSAMDGFAVRAADTPGELPVAFRVAAGSPSEVALPSGEAAWVSTGGVVPDGADTVVPIEATVDHGDRVEIPDRAESGRHVRPRGGDVAPGDVILPAGAVVRPSHVGALSAVGIETILCSRRPRVAVLATGSELRAPGETLRAGEIYESNRAMLAAALAEVGADIEVLPVVGDDHTEQTTTLEHALDADVVVSSGGVSVGPHDLVRGVARDLGVEEVFWGVAMKPGKPLSFGTRGSTLVFGLPGNPVSALVGALVFVRPALRALQGVSQPGPEYLVGQAGRPFVRNRYRDEFVRAITRVLPDALLLEPLTGQESHMIVRTSQADALVHVARGDGEIPAGAPVRYLRLA